MKTLATFATLMALCLPAHAAEPIHKKQVPPEKLFFIKTKYVMFKMPTTQYDHFDRFLSGKEKLKLFPKADLARADVEVISPPGGRSDTLVLKRDISIARLRIGKNCSLLFQSTMKDRDTTPSRILAFINCARGEAEVSGVRMTATFLGGAGPTENDFAANSDIILRSKLVTEGGQILQPGNVIRLTDWTDDAKTNEVELVSETPTDPIVPDDYL